MKKFIIEESEKERILGMHKTAIKNHYLNEESAKGLEDKPPYNVVSWADNEPGLSSNDISGKNYETLINYYKDGGILNKTAFLFNKVSGGDSFRLDNILTTFTIVDKLTGKTENGPNFKLLSGKDKTTPFIMINHKGVVTYHKNNLDLGVIVDSPIVAVISAEVVGKFYKK
jgi:hypothetical protein